MGITKNYYFTKRHCAVCSGTGIVEIPKTCEDAVAYFMYAQEHDISKCEMVEEKCPICNGQGWYFYEFED